MYTFETVIGHGTICELRDPAERRRALAEIMRQYSEASWRFDDLSIAKLRTWKLTIASLTGKRSAPVKPV